MVRRRAERFDEEFGYCGAPMQRPECILHFCSMPFPFGGSRCCRRVANRELSPQCLEDHAHAGNGRKQGNFLDTNVENGSSGDAAPFNVMHKRRESACKA